MMPPVPATNAVLQSVTCASPDRPITCRGRVDDVVHAAGHPGLPEGQLAAGGVQREVAAEGQVAFGEPRHALPFAQKPASSRLISTVIV